MVFRLVIYLIPILISLLVVHAQIPTDGSAGPFRPINTGGGNLPGSGGVNLNLPDVGGGSSAWSWNGGLTIESNGGLNGGTLSGTWNGGNGNSVGGSMGFQGGSGFGGSVSGSFGIGGGTSVLGRLGLGSRSGTGGFGIRISLDKKDDRN